MRKLNANDYTTSLTGMKFKVAHRRADSEKWSASERAQRRRMIKFLKEMLDELQKQDAASPQKSTRAKKPAGKRQRKTAA